MRRSAAWLGLVVAMGACAAEDDMDTLPASDTTEIITPESPTPGDTESVTVEMTNRQGGSAGVVHVMPAATGVQLHVQLTGLTPGEHGFHVHEQGECTPPAFESSGGHFAQEGQQHGLQNPQGPHTGDMPNLVANAGGAVDTTFTLDRLSLQRGAANAVFGRALVVHAGADDYRTDPAGAAGDRVACGVIRQ